jgi:hypothetical protein
MKVCEVPVAEVASYKTKVELATPLACIEVTRQDPVCMVAVAAVCAVLWSLVKVLPPIIFSS